MHFYIFSHHSDVTQRFCNDYVMSLVVRSSHLMYKNDYLFLTSSGFVKNRSDKVVDIKIKIQSRSVEARKVAIRTK